MNAARSGWLFSTRKDSLSSKGSEIYGGLVALARAEPFYAVHGVPDTPEGRLELIILHLVLAVRRLNRDGDPGNLKARAVMEAFVIDMDDCLREMGVGDIMVAKKVKKAAGALYDRIRDYGAALDAKNRDAVTSLFARHLTLEETGAEASGAGVIADYALRAEAQLAMLGASAIDTPETAFPAAPGSTGE